LTRLENIVCITFPEFKYIVEKVKPLINTLFSVSVAKKCHQYLKGINYYSDESSIIPFYIAYLKLQHNILVDIKDVKKQFVIKITNHWYRQNNTKYIRARYLCGNFY
jgi:hypothetical protein